MVRVTKGRTTMVKPASETPRHTVWLSNLDLMASASPVPIIYFYRADDVDKFADVAREALAKILVPYYPAAGRFRFARGGRLEIECCADGVAFTVAEADFDVGDFGDFAPTAQLRELVLAVDRSGGISSFPLLAVQITRFKCGAVSLGLSMEHRLCDGTSAINFINEWSQLSRDLNRTLSPPLIDRTFLRARDPPRSRFDHSLEYQPTIINDKTSKSSSPNDNIMIKTFVLKEHQVFALKSAFHSNQVHSTHEILLAHIWKCTCLARGRSILSDHDVETKLYIATSGRSRLVHPPCPRNFFGNVIFATSPVAVAKDIASKPLNFSAEKIREALVKMKDEEYLRSAVDFLEGLKPSLSERAGRGSVVYRSPNLGINSWVRMPLYDADFGMGRPFYVGPGEISTEGKAYLLPDSEGKNIFLAISLKAQDMARFEKLLYEKMC